MPGVIVPSIHPLMAHVDSDVNDSPGMPSLLEEDIDMLLPSNAELATTAVERGKHQATQAQGSSFDIRLNHLADIYPSSSEQ